MFQHAEPESENSSFNPIIISTESTSNFETPRPKESTVKSFTIVENHTNGPVAKKRRLDPPIFNFFPSTKPTSTREEKLCALVNAFLASGIDLDDIASTHWKEFVNYFEPEFVFPEKQEFATTFVQKAEKKYYDNLTAQGFQSFCYVYTEEVEGQVFVFSFAVTKSYKQIFLCSEIFNKDDCEEVLKCQLEAFCDTTVEHFATKYERSLKYVVYDGKLTLDDVGKVNDQTYFRLNCFSTLIHRLKKEHDPWHINSSTFEQEHKKITEYYKSVDDLNEKMVESRCSVGEGAEKAMELLQTYPKILNVTINDIIKLTLRPAVLGANYLNPKYKGRLTFKEPNLYDLMMDEFIHDACPPEGFDAFFDYTEASKDFEEFFRFTDDPLKFWMIAKRKHPECSNFALDLLAIPAVMPTVNKERLRKRQQKWSCDLSLQAFALTLVANDSC